MTELHMYLGYLMAWTIYQLWSTHRWIKSESKEEKAENAGHALEEVLNFISPKAVAGLAMSGIIFTGAADVLGILLVKGFIRDPHWLDNLLLGLVCVSIIVGIRSAIVAYRIVLSASNSRQPDLFLLRHERLFKKSPMNLEVVVSRLLPILYTGFAIYTMVILLQLLHIL